MSSKWFEVTGTMIKTLVVEIPDDYEPNRDRSEVAREFAYDNGFPAGADVTIESRDVLELVTDHDIKQAKRHADEVMPV